MRVQNIKLETFSQNLYKKKYSFLVITIILASILSPLSANALVTEKIADLMISGVLNFVRGVLGSLIALVGGWVDSVFSIPTTDVPVVRTSWEIVRNFANMFFVIILIIGAFATIFDVSTYDFRTMIGRFLVAALLINFSLVIGQIIIDWSQSLSNVFLQAIGSVGSRIAQGADIGGRFNEASLLASVAPTDTSIWLASIAVFANIILLSIILFSLVVLLFFSLVRVPILWALLILSPIAWVAYILPSTKKFNQDWWKYFLGWNMFLPIYLFFIYFGVLFLNNKEALGIVTSGTVVPGVNATLQTIFFYMLIGFFLIGGAKVAMSSSMAAGAGGVAAGIWARGKTAARFTGSRIPIFGGYSARDIGAGVDAKRKQLAEEGYRIPFTDTRMFGEQQRKEKAGKVAAFLGVRGAELSQQREFLNKTEREYKDLQDRFDTGKVSQLEIETKAKTGNASNPEGYAYLKMLAKLGNLDAPTYSKTLKELSNNPLAARDFAQTAKETKYSNLQSKELIEMTAGIDETGTAVHTDLAVGNLTPARKEQAKFIQSDEKIRSRLTQEQFNRLLSLLGGPNTSDGKNFMKDIGENRPDLVVDYSLIKNPATGAYADVETRNKNIQGYSIGPDVINPATGAIIRSKTDVEIDNEIKEKHYSGIMTTDTKKLALMPIESDPTKPRRVWDKPEFQQALETYIGSFRAGRSQRQFLTNMSTNLHNVKNAQERADKEAIFHTILGHLRIAIP